MEIMRNFCHAFNARVAKSATSVSNRLSRFKYPLRITGDKLLNNSISYDFQRLTISAIKTIAVLLFCLLSSCADIPPQMRVTEGASPQNQDNDVRFRTTYYFRVFDYCYSEKNGKRIQPLTDSLYRFIMTGKANAYANHVVFESGILKASQIDPFGATIEKDADGNVRFVSQAEVKARAERTETMKYINQLIQLKQRLLNLKAEPVKPVAGVGGGSGTPVVDQTTINALDNKITELANSLNYSPVSDPVSTAETAAGKSNTCPPGSSLQKGFQIMGPQGLKTFDQDDRLIMAMSSDAKPLIASLEEVSGRMLKTEGQKLSRADMYLPLIKEQLRVSELQRLILELKALKETNNEGDVSAKLEEVSSKLEYSAASGGSAK